MTIIDTISALHGQAKNYADAKAELDAALRDKYEAIVAQDFARAGAIREERERPAAMRLKAARDASPELASTLHNSWPAIEKVLRAAVEFTETQQFGDRLDAVERMRAGIDALRALEKS
jgi:hypothetical protein